MQINENMQYIKLIILSIIFFSVKFHLFELLVFS